MERIAIFNDHANTDQSFRNFNAQIDYLGLREYLGEGRLVVETFVYVPINPHNPEGKRNFIDFLRREGFFVRSKVGKPRPNNGWKCNFDVEMSVDILRFAREARVDIIVIGSGDGDMKPLCEEIRLAGVRCEIASTDGCLAPELLEAANGYINLGTIIQQQQTENPQTNQEPADRDVPDSEDIQPE